MRHVVFMRLIEIIAEVLMSELLALIYKPKVFILMPLQHKRDLSLHYEKNVNRLESLFIYNILSGMMLGFEKWRYPGYKVMMLFIF